LTVDSSILVMYLQIVDG